MKLLTTAAAFVVTSTLVAAGDVQLRAGDAAPEFEGDWFNHSNTSLEELRGHVVLLDVWRTWCGPCTAMIPHLNELHEEYADRGLKVVGITTESEGLIERHIEEHDMRFPLASVDQGEEDNYGIRGFPTSFLIDADGMIVWRGHPAKFEREFGRKRLERLLDETSIVPDISGQHRRIARYVDKGDLGDAWEKACDELEDGDAPDLVEFRDRIEAMVDARLAKVEDLCDEERYGQAAVILDQITETFDGMPQAEKAEELLDALEDDDDAEDDIDAYDDYVKAMEYWREGEFDRALETLSDIVDDYPDTGTAILADGILLRHDI